MKEKFDYDVFVEKAEINEEQAMKYKQQFIPDKLYKYQPIGDGRMKQKRLGAMRREEIWASRTKYLNDPFEFKMLYSNQDDDALNEFYEDVLERNEVICFSGKWNDKLMWSHYADSHRGICLEYSLRFGGKYEVFPMTYVKKRQNFENELSEWIKVKGEALSSLCKNHNMTEDQKRRMHICGKIMYTKDWIWKYEKEYRIVTRNNNDILNEEFDAYKEQTGSLHKTEKLDLQLSKVFLGLNCTLEDREDVIKMVKRINDNRIKKAIGYGKKDKKCMYHVLHNLDEIVTVYEVYVDDLLKLKFREV